MTRRKKTETTVKSCGACKWYAPNTDNAPRGVFVKPLNACEYEGRGTPESEVKIAYAPITARERMPWDGGANCSGFKAGEAGN